MHIAHICFFFYYFLGGKWLFHALNTCNKFITEFASASSTDGLAGQVMAPSGAPHTLQYQTGQKDKKRGGNQSANKNCEEETEKKRLNIYFFGCKF